MAYLVTYKAGTDKAPETIEAAAMAPIDEHWVQFFKAVPDIGGDGKMKGQFHMQLCMDDVERIVDI